MASKIDLLKNKNTGGKTWEKIPQCTEIKHTINIINNLMFTDFTFKDLIRM